jgi:hypothetical protein
MDADDADFSPVNDELKEILRLNKSVVLINNFYTPGKPFNHAINEGVRMDLNYIRGLIGERTNNIYYASIANYDNRGMAVIFTGYGDEELDNQLKGLPLIRESLGDGTLTLLGRSGRILLLGIGNHFVRTIIHNLFFENYISNCMSGYEIITFGFNEGVDICINVEDDFSEVLNRLPQGWMPDMCIMPDCEFIMLPRGIEHAPFFTVYIAYDWDYCTHTTRTFVESADLTIHDGVVSLASLGALGANTIDRNYMHGVREEFFASSPKKIKERKYDILYATSIDDIVWPDRSKWILKLCELADKYNVHIVPHTTYHTYFELLNDSKIAFSHNRIGEMSLRIFEASSQGTVTVETSRAVKRYFVPGEEYIHVTMDDIDSQIKRYLEDEDKLQDIADRVYKKSLEKFEPRPLFVKMLDFFYEKMDKRENFTRRINSLSDHEKHTRRGEIYYFAYFDGIRGLNWVNSSGNFLELSIKEFESAIAINRTPRSILNFLIARAAYLFDNYKDKKLSEKLTDLVSSYNGLIAEYPSYSAAYFNLALFIQY